MKQTENNEMDLLLRGLARREAGRTVAREAHSAEHLDTDELNSYAEQALPAAARARYTSHLAECARCRKLVSELAASSGAHVTAQSIAQSTSAGLRQKLAALFAPGIWRYAVPAVAILAFTGVALVVLNQRTGGEFVARNEATDSRPSTIEASPTGSPNQPEKFGDAREGQFSDSQVATGKDRDNFAKSEDKNEVPKETSKLEKSTDSLSVADNRQDASGGKAAGAVAQPQPSYAPEPAAPPPAKSEVTVESRTEVARRQTEEADKKKDEPAKEQEGARDRRDLSENQVAARTAKLGATAESQERTRTPQSKRASVAGEKAKNDDEAETRTVSGRRFRRQGNVWIDTAFQSSAATTIVTRGSEQFRALVADEPGVGAIAAQLPGEVVVVWKGRTYRIR